MANETRLRVRIAFAVFAVGIMATTAAMPGCRGCSKKIEKHADPGPLVTVSFGGDTLIGRRCNAHAEKLGLVKPLFGVKRIFSKSDLSLVNLEAVIASSGEMSAAKKGNPFFYRGRPEFVRMLVEGGVRAVSLANNHAYDYGPKALEECLEIVRKANISVIGAGKNLSEANAPVYFDLKGTVVAIVGVNTQGWARSRALKNRAGVSTANESKPDDFVKKVARQVKTARRFAHVVLLVAHWGPNKATEPRAHIRKIAARLVREADIDGVFGSSAHRVHGVEAIDGRPIVYDAGDFFWDRGNPNKRSSGSSAIFSFALDRNGVSRVEILPVAVGACRTETTTAKSGAKTLRWIAKASEKLGTTMRVIKGKAIIELARKDAPPSPERAFIPPKPGAISLPDPDSYKPSAVIQALPSGAASFPVVFENGVELIAYEIPSSFKVNDGIRVVTYWRTQNNLSKSYKIKENVRIETSGRRWYTELHVPGDWSYPSTRWRPGEIVKDDFFVKRFGKDSPGPHAISLQILDGSKPLRVLKPASLAGQTDVVVGKVEAAARATSK